MQFYTLRTAKVLHVASSTFAAACLFTLCNRAMPRPYLVNFIGYQLKRGRKSLTLTLDGRYLSSAFSSLAVPHFKLKTFGERSSYSVGHRMWISFEHFLHTGDHACTDAHSGIFCTAALVFDDKFISMASVLP